MQIKQKTNFNLLNASTHMKSFHVFIINLAPSKGQGYGMKKCTKNYSEKKMN
jgi:hypothetical protein